MKRWSLFFSLGSLLLFTGCGSMMTTTSEASPAKVSVTIGSANPNIRSGATEQFTAHVGGTANTSVIWSVNGVEGGSTAFGTIDSNGLFMAPNSVPSPNRVTVTATSVADSGVSGSVSRDLLNPVPQLSTVNTQNTATSIMLEADGNNFLPTSVIVANGVPLTTVFVDSSKLTAAYIPPLWAANDPNFSVHVNVSNPSPGAALSTVYIINLYRPTRQPFGASINTISAASRLLDQASFGPTNGVPLGGSVMVNDVATVNQMGMSQWIAAQMNPATTPPSTWTDFAPGSTALTNNPQCNNNGMICLQEQWFQNALSGPDQLRQRTAFALSEIWAVGGGTVNLSQSYTPFYQILNNDAFGNYRDLMNDVTLSSAMGYWLNMDGNDGAPTAGTANENYAREIMQLFTLGTSLLNDDGTYQVDGNGNPVPTYSETDIQNLARVFTGWSFAACTSPANAQIGCTGTTTPTWNMAWGGSKTDLTQPMVAYSAHHDITSKTFLGMTTTAGVPAATDLTTALDTIFGHSNVPAFICTQMIQHLVTSNPTPQYINRCSKVFENDGTGRMPNSTTNSSFAGRGNMDSVITAILLDPEARQYDESVTLGNNGHLREPVLMITSILRGLGFTNTNSTAWGTNLYNSGTNMEQDILFTPTVFNYFPSQYIIPQTNLYGPEFGIYDTGSTVERVNFVNTIIVNGILPGGLPGDNMTINVSAYSALTGTSASPAPANMVQLINNNFFHGQMSTGLQNSLIAAVNGMAGKTTTQMAQHALYLALTSSEYQIIH